MRPASIVNFERVVVLIILLGLVTTAFTWNTAVAMARQQGLGTGFVIGAGAFSLALNLLLLWLIARQRSVVAKWIYILLSLGGLALALVGGRALANLPTPLLLLNAAQWLLSLVSIYLLFRPDTRAWFGGTDNRSA